MDFIRELKSSFNSPKEFKFCGIQNNKICNDINISLGLSRAFNLVLNFNVFNEFFTNGKVLIKVQIYIYIYT